MASAAGVSVRFSEVIAGIDIVRHSGPDVEVSGIEYDSRRVKAGALFVATRGGSADGNCFIAAAIDRGATAIVTDSAEAFNRVALASPQIALAEVTGGRRALAGLSANFYAHPEKKLALSGVTGTNGKTTTAYLLDAMLNHHGGKTILVGTIEYHVAREVRPSPHTTPESRDLFELFAEGVEAGATEAVMEVSSHALDQGRTWGLGFDVAIFTNLTQDHLDYHGAMQRYFEAKRSLFDGHSGSAPRVAVVNLDDRYGLEIAEAARIGGSEVFGYGMDVGAFRAGDVEMHASGMRFEMTTPDGSIEIATRLTGKINVYNLLAASAAAMARGLGPKEVAAGAASVKHVPGRFQSVNAGQPFAVIVDYAHTDDALRNLLAIARGFVSNRGGRVITLFGCGGDRDRAKRPLMGRAAGEGSDLVVATSDNPRTEDPMAILDEIIPALRETGTEFIAEPDRAQAIEIAIGAATPGDIVLLAGKGHEKVQTLRDRTIPFDDVQIALSTLARLGFLGGEE